MFLIRVALFINPLHRFGTGCAAAAHGCEEAMLLNCLIHENLERKKRCHSSPTSSSLVGGISRYEEQRPPSVKSTSAVYHNTCIGERKFRRSLPTHAERCAERAQNFFTDGDPHRAVRENLYHSFG